MLRVWRCKTLSFHQTKLRGAFIIDPQILSDERGFFARTWCEREFQEHGLDFRLVQSSISFSSHEGTLRGMHYQTEPHAEAKVIRCTMGAVHDVIVDVRVGSPTRGEWIGLDLTAENRRMLYVPEGVAHGFLTRLDGTEVLYSMSEFYTPEASRGVRWNDPAFGIEWPGDVRVIADRDRIYSDFVQ